MRRLILAVLLALAAAGSVGPVSSHVVRADISPCNGGCWQLPVHN